MAEGDRGAQGEGGVRRKSAAPSPVSCTPMMASRVEVLKPFPCGLAHEPTRANFAHCTSPLAWFREKAPGRSREFTRLSSVDFPDPLGPSTLFPLPTLRLRR